MAVYTDSLNLIKKFIKIKYKKNMFSKRDNYQKKITSICYIKNIHISAAELRSYTIKELITIFKRLSNTSICKSNNSFYRTSYIY